MGKKIVIEKDEQMHHTLVRLLVDVSESLRRDFSAMAEGNSYSTVRRVKKHISNLRKIMKEMAAATEYKREKIAEDRWGGVVPAKYYKAIKKRKAESEPLIL